MIECLIVGDSIAVGTAVHKPECVTIAKVGITSRGWNSNFNVRELEAGAVVISLGSNDSNSAVTKVELSNLRQDFRFAKKVFWIVPAVDKPKIVAVIKEIAESYGDELVYIPNVSRDGIHPTQRGYKKLAKSISY
jgi:lysophospholipase L1-like esterase